MDWQSLVVGIVSLVVMTLLSWVLAQVRTWIKSKTKDSKCSQCLTRAIDVIESSVKMTYQTYVEALKGKDAFTKEAQQEALKKAKDAISSQITEDVRNYIDTNFGNFETWVTNQIESSIYDLKNRN